jgi:hypothetical protein
MSFIQFPTTTPVFPALPSQGWSTFKKPIMASRVTIGTTGRENQLACAAYPRWAFTLTFNQDSYLRDQTQNIIIDPEQAGFTEFTQLSGLFLRCLGSYGEFYYSDPDDNSRLGQFVAQTASGVTAPTYQMTYEWGNGPFTPPLRIPVGGIQSIQNVYFNGTVVSPTQYTLDATNTKLVFVSVPNNTLVTADFTFYFRCRFLDDSLEFAQMLQNWWQVKELRFESVKP